MSIWSWLKRTWEEAPCEPEADVERLQFDVTAPRDGSHTGRYAILHADNTSGYPNWEDYILLARRPGELFRTAYMVHVPFDEEPPILLDYVDQPEVAVIYQGFTFAWTDDGGHTIRRPPKEPKGLFDLHRFGDHGIGRVEAQDGHLYVKMTEGRGFAFRDTRGPFAGDDGDTRMWRFRLDGSSDAAEFVDPPIFPPRPDGREDLPVRGGTEVQMRVDAQGPWVEIPPEDLMKQLQAAKIDFFGGTGARSF